MNPFDEAYEGTVKIQGLSSGDMQRRIYILSERVRYLYEIHEAMSKEINELKAEKQAAAKKARTSKDVSEPTN